MSAFADDGPPWVALVNELALISHVSREEIRPESRLVEDLGLDSLALTEVVVMVIETYNPAGFQKLDDRVWEGLTVRQLYEECSTRGAD